MAVELNRISLQDRLPEVSKQEGRVLSRQEMAFGNLLTQQLQKDQKEVQFSKHAAERARQRGIEMTPNLLQDLNQAVAKARSKGAKDVAVIGPSGAFIVNVPNNVVITSIAQGEMKDNVFTNIDSAVMI